MPSHLRWIAVVLAVLAAATFAFSVQTAWWSIGEVAIGPFGSRHCFGGECRASGLGWIGGTDLWMRSAIATRVAGYIAMFALVMLGGALAAKREPRLVARFVVASIVTAVAAGAYYAAAFPGLTGASLDRGVFAFIVAVVLGALSVVLFLRAPRAAT